MTDAVPGVVELPEPDPAWGPAGQVHGHRNPVFQASLWEMSGFGDVVCLRVRFADVVRRLQLHVEATWEDRGPVELATFRLDRVGYAVWRYVPDTDETNVALKSVPVEERPAAIARLLAVLGTGWEAAYMWTDDGATYVPVDPVNGGPLTVD
jgi:hypothetical protein